MKKIYLLVIAFLFCFTNSIFALNDWDKAVEIYKENKMLQPHKTIFNSYICKADGEVEKNIMHIYNINYIDNTKPDMQIIQAIEDGKDVTKKVREDLKDPSKNKGPGDPKEFKGITEHPLDDTNQDKITKIKREESVIFEGYNCSIWDFTFILNDKYSGKGTAWIEKESGKPIYFKYKIVPDSTFIKDFCLELYFDSDDGKNWITQQIKMSGNFIFLFIKKSFSTSSKMHNWGPEKLEKAFFSMDTD